jgi:hypothetical protein
MDLARDFYREVQAGNFEEATNFISHSDLSKEDALKLLTTIQTMRGDLDSVQTTTTGSVFTVAEGGHNRRAVDRAEVLLHTGNVH